MQRILTTRSVDLRVTLLKRDGIALASKRGFECA
jgi:hypothetical protein